VEGARAPAEPAHAGEEQLADERRVPGRADAGQGDAIAAAAARLRATSRSAPGWA